MSGSQGAEGPSRSPRRASFETAAPSTYQSRIVTSSRPLYSPRVPSVSMPKPERNLYSNKESAKVNVGLYLNGLGGDENETDCTISGAFKTNIPAVEIDLSKLNVHTVAPEPTPSVERLIRQLLQPPRHAFLHGMLSIQWVIGVVGHRHMVFRGEDERYVLAAESELRTLGTVLGLPVLYSEWLCGDNYDLSATEQGIYLTPKYFEEVAKGLPTSEYVRI